MPLNVHYVKFGLIENVLNYLSTNEIYSVKVEMIGTADVVNKFFHSIV